VNCYKALYIPSTGIIDSHSVMSKLEYLSKNKGVDFLYNTSVTAINKKDDYYKISINNSDDFFESDIIINAAGLWSEKISSMIGINNYEQSKIFT